MKRPDMNDRQAIQFSIDAELPEKETTKKVMPYISHLEDPTIKREIEIAYRLNSLDKISQEIMDLLYFESLEFNDEFGHEPVEPELYQKTSIDPIKLENDRNFGQKESPKKHLPSKGHPGKKLWRHSRNIDEQGLVDIQGLEVTLPREKIRSDYLRRETKKGIEYRHFSESMQMIKDGVVMQPRSYTAPTGIGNLLTNDHIGKSSYDISLGSSKTRTHLSDAKAFSIALWDVAFGTKSPEEYRTDSKEWAKQLKSIEETRMMHGITAAEDKAYLMIPGDENVAKNDETKRNGTTIDAMMRSPDPIRVGVKPTNLTETVDKGMEYVPGTPAGTRMNLSEDPIYSTRNFKHITPLAAAVVANVLGYKK